MTFPDFLATNGLSLVDLGRQADGWCWVQLRRGGQLIILASTLRSKAKADGKGATYDSAVTDLIGRIRGRTLEGQNGTEIRIEVPVTLVG